jgi:hypothetical protein
MRGVRRRRLPLGMARGDRVTRPTTLRERAPADVRELLALIEKHEGSAAADRAFAAWLDTLSGAAWILSDSIREFLEAVVDTVRGRA